MDQNDRLLGHDRAMTAYYLELGKNLTDAQWDQEFDIGHRTLRRTFDHMTEAIDYWMGFMTGALAQREIELKTPEELVVQHREAYDRFEAFARSIISEGRLDETFEDGWEVRHSYGASILHVILHGQTHRTEILHMFHRLGLEDLPEGDPQEWEWELRRQGMLPTA